MTEEMEVLCDYCAKPFVVSPAEYDAHDAWFCSAYGKSDPSTGCR